MSGIREFQTLPTPVQCAARIRLMDRFSTRRLPNPMLIALDRA